MNRRSFLYTSAMSAGSFTLASMLGCATTPKSRDESVIVVGAGISGIAAAQALQESGYRVQILEAQSRNGGRMITNRAFGVPIDMGAAWIHGERRNPVTKLANRYGASYAPTDWTKLSGYENGVALSGQQLADSRHRLSAIYSKTYWKEATEGVEGQIDEIVARAVRRSRDSSESFGPVEDYLTLSEQTEIWELRKAALQVDAEYREFGGGDQIMTGGYDTIVSGLSEGLTILNNQVVEKIALTASGVSVTTSRGIFTADRVVITLPLGVLKKRVIEFEPGLPDEKMAALDRLGMTTLNKIVVVFPKAFWPNDSHGLVQLNSSDAPHLFFNLHHFQPKPVLVYLASSAHGREIEQFSDGDAIGYTTGILKDMFGSNIPDATTGIRTRWASNRFSYGSFSYRKAGSSPGDRDTLAEAVDNRLFFAGEATHARRYGTVHGAYLSGLRVAEDVIRA